MAVETEVVTKAARRRFTAAEKLRVLREADRCTKPGELSALLRRERMYSSRLSAWRAARKGSRPSSDHSPYNSVPRSIRLAMLK